MLEVKYRGLDIAEVLDMTAREAFTFFRGQRKVQAKLKQLLDVGLDYLRLGQPATTLSGGEAQRLKLAAHLAAKRRGRTLFLLDEPTTGLHFSDIVQLLDCFDALLEVGHSLVIVEHNLQLMKAADWIIDLGPGAADEAAASSPPARRRKWPSVPNRSPAESWPASLLATRSIVEEDAEDSCKTQSAKVMPYVVAPSNLCGRCKLKWKSKSSVGDVTDMEARVIARSLSDRQSCCAAHYAGRIAKCARTLPAEFPFRDLAPQQSGCGRGHRHRSLHVVAGDAAFVSGRCGSACKATVSWPSIMARSA